MQKIFRLRQAGWITACLAYSPLLYAQAISFGGDQVASTVDNTVKYLQVVGIGILSINVARNLIKMGRDDQDSERAKKGVVSSIIGIAGLMILKGIISVIQSLTGSSFMFGF